MFPLLRLLIALVAAVTTATAIADDISAQVLEEMNLARTQPQQYAEHLSARMTGPRVNLKDVAEAVRFLKKARPLPPLAFSPGMTEGARLHVSDLGPRGGRGHYGAGKSTPWSRIGRFGQWIGAAGENIYYGKRDARGIVCALIVDTGVAGRKHRKNIFSRNFTVAGVAYGSHTGFGAMCVMDFAGGYVEGGSQLARL
jgi:uncharacterized protein YkwD